jgi:hypothetical protein
MLRRRLIALRLSRDAAVRQIESAISSRLPDPLGIGQTETSMSKPDPMLAQIAAQFHAVRRGEQWRQLYDSRASHV